METITAYILQNVTLCIIISGLLIAIAGVLLQKFRIVSIVLILLASMIIYVLIYKTSPIPSPEPQIQENQEIRE